jgi:hypothetical protein
MGEERPRIGLGHILLLVVGFVVFSAIILPLWWYLMPWYAGLVGRIAGWLAGLLGAGPIEAVVVEPGGILNTQTEVTYVMEAARPSIEVANWLTNMAPYLALVLATPGITWGQRLRALLGGVAILVAVHILLLGVPLAFGRLVEAYPQVYVAIGFVSITLPFLLWLLLAYRRHLAAFLGGRPAPPRS